MWPCEVIGRLSFFFGVFNPKIADTLTEPEIALGLQRDYIWDRRFVLSESNCRDNLTEEQNARDGNSVSRLESMV
jgi:hypothetical protein